MMWPKVKAPELDVPGKETFDRWNFSIAQRDQLEDKSELNLELGTMLLQCTGRCIPGHRANTNATGRRFEQSPQGAKPKRTRATPVVRA